MDDQAGVGHQTDEALGSRQLARTVAAATQLAGEVIALMAVTRDRAAQVGEARLRAARASARDRHRRDAAVWRMATQRWWWEQASDQDIARAWVAASTWAPGDEQARAAQRHIADRLARRGVQVTAPDARPGDAAWLREAGAADAAQDPDGPPPGPQFHLGDGDAQRLTDLARAHWTAKGRDADAAAILGAPGQEPPAALPAFLYRLGQYEALGGRVTDALDGIWLPADVRVPAAFAEWQVEQAVVGISEVLEDRRGQAREVIQRRLAALDVLTPDTEAVEAQLRAALTAADRDIAQAVNPLPVLTRLASDPRLDERTRAELGTLSPRRSAGAGANREGGGRAASQGASSGSRRQRRSRKRQAGTASRQAPRPDPQAAARYEQLVRHTLDLPAGVVDAMVASPWWTSSLVPTLRQWEQQGRDVSAAWGVVRHAVTDPQVAMPAAWAGWQLRHIMGQGTPHADPRMAAVRAGHPATARDAAAHGRSAGPQRKPAVRRRDDQQRQATTGQRG